MSTCEHSPGRSPFQVVIQLREMHEENWSGAVVRVLSKYGRFYWSVSLTANYSLELQMKRTNLNGKALCKHRDYKTILSPSFSFVLY